MSLSFKALERQNYFNTIQVLQDLRTQEKQEMGLTSGGTGLLGRADVSCVDFMRADPNRQLAYAKQSGFFPDEGEL